METLFGYLEKLIFILYGLIGFVILYIVIEIIVKIFSIVFKIVEIILKIGIIIFAIGSGVKMFMNGESFIEILKIEALFLVASFLLWRVLVAGLFGGDTSVDCDTCTKKLLYGKEKRKKLSWTNSSKKFLIKECINLHSFLYLMNIIN